MDSHKNDSFTYHFEEFSANQAQLHLTKSQIKMTFTTWKGAKAGKIESRARYRQIGYTNESQCLRRIVGDS